METQHSWKRCEWNPLLLWRFSPDHSCRVWSVFCSGRTSLELIPHQSRKKQCTETNQLSSYEEQTRPKPDQTSKVAAHGVCICSTDDISPLSGWSGIHINLGAKRRLVSFCPTVSKNQFSCLIVINVQFDQIIPNHCISSLTRYSKI